MKLPAMKRVVLMILVIGTLLELDSSPPQKGRFGGTFIGAIVAEDGIYPFRILWWQGGGGVNMEFLTVDRNTGSQALVNDRTGAVRSVVAVSGNLTSPIGGC